MSEVPTKEPEAGKCEAPNGSEPLPDASAKDAGSANAPPARRLSGRTITIGAIALVALAAAGAWYYFSTKDFETTDDAQVAGNSVTIAPKISGQVVELAVKDNQRVKAGDLLVRIDASDLTAVRDQALAALAIANAQLGYARANLALTKVTAPAKLAAAKATRDAAVANAKNAQAELKRQDTLTNLATTQQSKDQAEANSLAADATVAADEAQVQASDAVAETVQQAQAQVDQAQAQVRQAQAQLATASLNLTYTEVRAPQDGWITMRNVQLGSYVQPGQALLSLVTPDVWIVANFKENQLDRMRPGQPVTIKLDAYRGLTLKGHVDSVQMGTGSVFTAFPAENATGNFVKIVQRVPVKIVIDSGLDPTRPPPLGLSAEPEVNVK